MSTKLAALATASPLELLSGDLAIVAANLQRAQKELEAATGGRHSWLDAPIAIAKDRASNPIPAAAVELPHVVLCMEGGIITSTLAATPIMVTVIDYDTEDCADRNDLVLIPQGDGKMAEAYATVDQAFVDAARTTELIEAVESPIHANEEHPGHN